MIKNSTFFLYLFFSTVLNAQDTTDSSSITQHSRDIDSLEMPTIHIIYCPDEEESINNDIPIDYALVETKPKFPGGEKALMNHIASHIVYPASAYENKQQGRVYIKFSVDKNGFVTDVKVLRGVNPEIDAEAVRVIKGMPKWTSGSNKEKPVKVSFVMPVKFKIE